MRAFVAGLAVALAAGLSADSVGAQQKTVRTDRPAGRPRAGAMPAPVIEQAPAAARTHPRDRRDHDGRGHRDHRPSYIVLGDGTVLADLGWGYEQVIRSCSVMGVPVPPSGGTGTVVTGGGSSMQPVTTRQAPAPYTPPQYIPPVATTAPAPRAACWTTDANGRIVVVQL